MPYLINYASRGCRNGFCGAWDCKRCHGNSAHDFMTPCGGCDEPNAEECTCGECVCQKNEEECECDLSMKYEPAEADY